MRRVCILCPEPAVAGRSRCSRHGPTSPAGPSPYDAHHQALAKQVLTGATVCWICGQPPTPGNPLQADHKIPLSLGGHTTIANMAPAHRSCNISKGGANRK